MSQIIAKALKGQRSAPLGLHQLIDKAHELCKEKVLEVIKESVGYMNDCDCKKLGYKCECKLKHHNLIRTNVCPFHKNKDTELYNIIVLEIIKFDTFFNKETCDINLYTIKFAVCKECMKTFYVIESNFMHSMFIISNIKFIDAVVYYKKLRSEFKLCHHITPKQYEMAQEIDNFNCGDCKILKLHKLFK
jgi:hypothetical protein